MNANAQSAHAQYAAPWPARLAAWLSPALLAGCAGSGQGLDANGRPAIGGGGGPLTADFASIQSQIFTPICTACHVGGSAPQGLRLDEVNSYAMLVGVSSSEVSSLQRISAGDPDHSYLIQKLEGHAAVGARMPLGGPYLEQATINVIRQWITDGAQPALLAAPAALSVQAVAPAPGDTLAAGNVRIIVAFTAVLDQTRLDGTSARLERLDAQSGNVLEIMAVTLQVPLGNDRALIVTPVNPLRAGRYRLLATQPPASGLNGIGGERLQAAVSGAELRLTEFEVQE